MLDVAKRCAEQIQSLQTQIKALQDEIDQAFKPLEDDAGAYHLHAVCIHDGSAESGHYYTLIKEHTTNIWRKFNDIKVETIAEKDVFENANGGFGQKTAFWVVYLSKSETQTASQFQLYQMSNNNHYSAKIDSKLQFDITN